MLFLETWKRSPKFKCQDYVYDWDGEGLNRTSLGMALHVLPARSHFQCPPELATCGTASSNIPNPISLPAKSWVSDETRWIELRERERDRESSLPDRRSFRWSEPRKASKPKLADTWGCALRLLISQPNTFPGDFSSSPRDRFLPCPWASSVAYGYHSNNLTSLRGLIVCRIRASC